jgi:hypothetical protein
MDLHNKPGFVYCLSYLLENFSAISAGLQLDIQPECGNSRLAYKVSLE